MRYSDIIKTDHNKRKKLDKIINSDKIVKMVDLEKKGLDSELTGNDMSKLEKENRIDYTGSEYEKKNKMFFETFNKKAIDVFNASTNKLATQLVEVQNFKIESVYDLERKKENKKNQLLLKHYKCNEIIKKIIKYSLSVCLFILMILIILHYIYPAIDNIIIFKILKDFLSLVSLASFVFNVYIKEQEDKENKIKIESDMQNNNFEKKIKLYKKLYLYNERHNFDNEFKGLVFDIISIYKNKEIKKLANKMYEQKLIDKLDYQKMGDNYNKLLELMRKDLQKESDENE